MPPIHAAVTKVRPSLRPETRRPGRPVRLPTRCPSLDRHRMHLLACLAALQLAACGGGGGAAEATATPAPPPSAAAPPAAPPASDAPPAAPPVAPAPPAPSSSDLLSRAVALSAAAAVGGVREAPAASTAPASPAGRVFHIDSQRGDDRLDGRAAAAGSATGPWRTLGRLAAATELQPGDRIELACGSVWREVLRLPRSGATGRPIVVAPPEAGCATGQAPVVDGSQAIEPATWQRTGTATFGTALESPVLQLHGGTLAWIEAHHPNRGGTAEAPLPPYAAVAADSAILPNAACGGSDRLETGDDLQLPPGATIAAGTRLRVRLNAWFMEEHTVAAADGRSLRLSQVSRCPVAAGWGYFLLGQAWMADTPGEWAYDAATRQLTVRTADDAPPTAALHATVLPVALDLRGRTDIAVSGIVVRRVGTGADLRQAQRISLRGLRIEDTAGTGVDASVSRDVTLESLLLERIGGDGIVAHTDTTGEGTGLVLRGSVLRDIGVLMRGEAVVSLPRGVRAAVRSGASAVVEGNTILNTGYLGIWAGTGSRIERNVVFGTCSMLDDCGAIYASAAAGNRAVIRQNVVVRSRGAIHGRPTAARYTQAQGVYLDESVTGVLVEDNTVVDADHGIQLHVSALNVVRGNRLMANRSSQIWLQETRNRDNPGGDLHGNIVENNLLAPAHPAAVALLLTTRYASTAHFGRFEGNRYFDRIASVIAQANTASGVTRLPFAEWQASQGQGSTSPVDTTGWAATRSGFAAFATRGANLVRNGNLAQDASGWAHWNATAPAGSLLREVACVSGRPCLRYQAGGSPGIVSSANFSLEAGRWYRLSLDIATEAPDQTVELVVRRGGGGTNGFESLTTAGLTFRAGTAWRRHSVLFQANRTVWAGDPITLDRGARVDIQSIQAGRGVALANLEVVPVEPDATALALGIVINAGPADLPLACPLTGTAEPLCTTLRNLADDSTPQWPLALPGHTAAVLIAQNPAMADRDLDGVRDSDDRCPDSPPGAAVDAAGCGIAQAR